MSTWKSIRKRKSSSKRSSAFSRKSIIDARAVSSLGTDGVSVVDTSDCGDWLPADLENYCSDWPDNLCTTKTSSDGCETVGKVISFAYDGTQVTP